MADCICPRFRDAGRVRIADLTCPVHGIGGPDEGDGYWDDEPITADPVRDDPTNYECGPGRPCPERAHDHWPSET